MHVTVQQMYRMCVYMIFESLADALEKVEGLIWGPALSVGPSNNQTYIYG